ncbi:hypothetical protein PTI45_03988 [Paenibacillus nuruki]|uniref:Uncharacterized protein n=1 Tax=Paenibacillus nuruki TaxID=1886670 RepID=A0A1E3L133_9BACL|nr:hypothetical protein [Paenibacillus nuruki]ODP26670.1 hypothetical protein PTI45_03988 [Paenibacillus nuruki]
MSTLDVTNTPNRSDAQMITPALNAGSNNTKLFQQIKAELLAFESTKMMATLAKHERKFFVRNNQLHISYNQISIPLGITTSVAVEKENPDSNTELVGLDRKKLKTYLILIENTLTNIDPIDYGEITLGYEIQEDGSVNGNILIQTQVNHSRL